MNIRSKEGALRRYAAILNACRRDLAGGLQYGMDWPTLRGTFPERYAELRTIRAQYDTLPSRVGHT